MLTAILVAAIGFQSRVDPEVAEAAAAAYMRELRVIEKKALGMSVNRGTKFRKAEREAAMKRVTEKFKVTENDMRDAARRRMARDRATSLSDADATARAKLVAPGMVAPLDPGAIYSFDRSIMADAWTRFNAGDIQGLMPMLYDKRLSMCDDAVNVRVIEVYNLRAIGREHVVRVRLLAGPDSGKEAYCLPQQIESRPNGGIPPRNLSPMGRPRR